MCFRLKLAGLAMASSFFTFMPLLSIFPFQQSALAQTNQDQLTEAMHLNQEGQKLKSQGDLKAALAKYEQALAITRLIGEQLLQASILNNIGGIYDSRGDYSKAQRVYQGALEIFREKAIRETSPIESQWGEGGVLAGIAGVYINIGEYPKALAFGQQALDIFQSKDIRTALPLESSNGQAATLNLMGIIYSRTGEYSRALDLYQQALAIRQSIGDRFGESATLSNIGAIYARSGQHASAIDFFQQALEIQKTIGDYFSESTSLNNICVSYSNLGRYSKALESCQKALQVSISTNNRSNESTALNSIGNIYKWLGQYSLALKSFQKALSIDRSIGNNSGVGILLNNIGGIYADLEEYPKAISFYQQALAIHEKVGNRTMEVTTLNNIGVVYRSQGQYQKALEPFQKSLLINKKIGDRTSNEAILSNIGLVYENMGQCSKALEFYQLSLDANKITGSPRSKGISLNNIGQCLFLMNQPQAAETNLFAAVDALESLRPDLSDADKVSLFETITSVYRSLSVALIAQNKVEPALEVSDRARARSLVELLGSRQTTNPIAMAKPLIAQIKQIAQTQRATLVQYAIVSDKDLYIWVIQPDGNLHFHKTDLSQLKTPLNQIIATSRKTIGARGRDVRSDIEVTLTPEKQRQIEQQQTQNLRKLYQILIKPIATHLPQDPNQRVILLPQGNLNLVPFAALQAEDGNYLIDQHTLLTAPSIQTLELTRKQADRLRQQPSTSNTNLVIGNPTMPKVVAQLGDEPTQLRSLPGTETEAKAIAPLLNTQPLIGATATKANVLERMKTARVIHLATHGLLDSIKGDVPGAIALAPDGTGERNDGLLTAGEIYDRFAQPGKPALNADLVVLSACDTGRGDIKGEGVIGLSRTLFAAGVPSVLVSLWEVPDAPTAFLMTEFYTNWQTRKLDKARSLRQAILTTKRKFPRPLDWAAFTLIGEAE
jgi:CHAT domain-containing protein/Tfp pilus assembly protein PilF